MFHLITSLIQKKKGLLDWLLLCGWEGRWAKPILTDSHWFMGDSTCTTELQDLFPGMMTNATAS